MRYSCWGRKIVACRGGTQIEEFSVRLYWRPASNRRREDLPQPDEPVIINDEDGFSENDNDRIRTEEASVGIQTSTLFKANDTCRKSLFGLISTRRPLDNSAKRQSRCNLRRFTNCSEMEKRWRVFAIVDAYLDFVQYVFRWSILAKRAVRANWKQLNSIVNNLCRQSMQ